MPQSPDTSLFPDSGFNLVLTRLIGNIWIVRIVTGESLKNKNIALCGTPLEIKLEVGNTELHKSLSAVFPKPPFRGHSTSYVILFLCHELEGSNQFFFHLKDLPLLSGRHISIMKSKESNRDARSAIIELLNKCQQRLIFRFLVM